MDMKPSPLRVAGDLASIILAPSSSAAARSAPHAPLAIDAKNPSCDEVQGRPARAPIAAHLQVSLMMPTYAPKYACLRLPAHPGCQRDITSGS
jgi:hypothetical protein